VIQNRLFDEDETIGSFAQLAGNAGQTHAPTAAAVYAHRENRKAFAPNVPKWAWEGPSLLPRTRSRKRHGSKHRSDRHMGLPRRTIGRLGGLSVRL
jgi:hypothetical protein